MKKISASNYGKREDIYIGKFIFALLVFYLIALAWAIMFKFKTNLNELKHFGADRILVLTPYFLKNSRFYKADVISNIIAFIPYGVYLPALKLNNKTGLNLTIDCIIIMCTSFLFEVLQYAFNIGCADISDLINNTLGGIIGIALYYIFYLIFRKNTEKAVCIAGGVVTAAAAALITVSFLSGSLDNIQARLALILDKFM